MTLSLLVDEPVPASVVALLRERGHAVYLVAEVLPADASDALVAGAAREQGWTLVTWNQSPARGPSRIDFRGDESRAGALAARYLPDIEARLARTTKRPIVVEVVERVESSLRVVRR
jgi:hypothetical protein